MAVAVLDHDVETLLQLLSRLPSQQLAIVVTQHPNLSSIIVHALGDLAAASISEPSLASSSSKVEQQGSVIADLVRKLIARGDPSLVNKLLPRSSLIDLALCTNAKDVLARLIDETGAYESIRAAATAFEKSSKGLDEERVTRISRAAHLLARVVSSMPIRKVAEEKLTKGQRERGSEECTLLCNTIASIRGVYEELGSTATLPVFKTKISLLDAAWFLSERLLSGFLKSSLRSLDKVLDDYIVSLCGSSSMQTGSTPLSDMPFAVDLALVRPVVDGIRAVTRSYSSNNLDVLNGRVRGFAKTSNSDLDVSSLGLAWDQVVTSAQSSLKKNPVSEGLVDSILAVLPSLGSDRAGLESRLRGSQFAGKDAETIIQTLFDEEDGAKMESTEFTVDEDVEALRILQERANIFNEQPMENVTVTRGKGREREAERFDLSSGLSEEIRAAILARAEQPESDEEEIWNPFSDAVLEVGFEEEMEEEQEIPIKTVIRRGTDDDDEEEEEENEEGEVDGGRGAAGHGGAPIESSKVAAERAAERILISAWSERGESFFTKETRKAAARSELKLKLNNLPGKQWDDGLIESWATMFGRNPRKEKLLAAVNDIMLLGNQNLAGSESSGFGVNRGRGGRIMREPGEGGRGARGRGRGRGSNRGSRGGAKRGRGSA